MKTLLLLEDIKKYILKFVLKTSNVHIIYVDVAHILSLVTILKKHRIFKYNMLLDLFVVDYPENKFRFEVNYYLLSLNFNIRLLIKTYVEESGVVESMTKLFSSSMWMEREAWDFFGVFFLNNDDLRRILTDYGFLGHPGRKDFPISGFIELRYDDAVKSVVAEPLELSQEMRFFDFTNPWFKNIEKD